MSDETIVNGKTSPSINGSHGDNELIINGELMGSFYAPLVSNLSTVVGLGDATFSRAFVGTVKDYNDNVQSCASGEARFEGARRIHEGLWSDQSAENAIEFDGADDDVLVSDNSAIQNVFDGGGTISCWIKPKSQGETTGRIIDKEGRIIFFVGNEVAGFVKLEFLILFSGSDGRWILTNADIPINQLTHVAITYNSSDSSNQPTFYINTVSKTVGSGLTETSSPSGTRDTDAGRDLYIGNNSSQSRSFDGPLDNLKIFTTELTATEVAAEYNQGRKSTNLTQASSLAGWWKLDDTDSSITDYSGNGNTGTFRSGGVGASPTNVDGRYDDGTTLTTLKGILIEEQRTNEIDYSEALDNATGGWTETACTVTLNQALSPDGINSTATKVVPTVGAGTKGISKSFAGLSDNTVYMFSVFAKYVDFQWIRMTHQSKDGSAINSWFDIQNGVTGTINHTYYRIESFAGGWYRLSIGADLLTGATAPGIYIRLADSNENTSATGDGSKYNLFWGAQVEEGSMATSYIATSGATATRLKDVLWYPAANNVNELEGSMVCDFNMLGLDASSTPGILSISDNSASDFINLEGLATNNNAILNITDGSTPQGPITGSNDSIVPNTDQSIGAVYKLNDTEGFVDGSSFGTDATATMPSGLTRVYIGATEQGSDQLNGTIKEVKIYKKKLQGSEMEIKTS